MEYVYAALILHEADSEISEENVRDVLEAATVEIEESRVRALVAALEDVDIEDAIADTAFGAGAPVPADSAAGAPAEGAEESAEEEAAEAEPEPEEDDDEDETTGEGLGELFG
ncbi:50S ribosomal protein P1 [Natrinema pallidum]|uniref:Large ribosomal subunit protein P1 n=1 Tax=Natrinema pallidum TaxID=69527 RepID=A0A4V1IF91_9EURY|nr:50S ribosomal protein P1 [Natrinema pallidum]QCW04174.1 50S ribosomal protein P1 [Natrinema pallidum]